MTDCPSPASPPGAPRPSRRSARGKRAKVVGLIVVILLYLWDDALFAAPVIGAVALWGPLKGWLICSVVYAAVSLAIALFLVRARPSAEPEQQGALTRWLTSNTLRRSPRWLRGLLASGALMGFVASSVLLGGIATTWLTHRLVPHRPVLPTAVAASSIFGFTFCALYGGMAATIF